MRAPVSLRVNPDVDAGTHPYIATGLKENKFGIPYADALALYAARARASPNVRIEGIDCHIGSQLTEIEPIAEALGKIAELVERLAGRRHRARRTSTSAAASASATGTRRPPALADYAQAVTGGFPGPAPQAPVRARAAPDRQRRRAADAHRVPEARRGPQFRHRRRRDERPRAARPVRGVARRAAGARRRRAPRPTTSSARVRDRGLHRARARVSRPAKAICSRSCRPARTA